MATRRWSVSWLAGVGGVAVVGAGLVWAIQSISPRPAANANSDARRQYADLYQLAWRQDSGQGSVLVTATVFPPALTRLLGQQSPRSETEEQVWRAVRGLDQAAVPFFVTIDSVAGPLTDDQIAASLSLTAVGGPTFKRQSWIPIILPAKANNNNVSTASQAGVVVFAAEAAVDWANLRELRLRSEGLGDVPTRDFRWIEPAKLVVTPS